jgi:hypothetical protein
MSTALKACLTTLSHVNRKIKRLSRQIDRYYTNSLTISYRDDLETASRTYIVGTLKEIPLSFSLQVTEIACLMRAALDHLFFEIIQSKRSSPIPAAEHVEAFPCIHRLDQVDKKLEELKTKYQLDQDTIDWLKSHQGCSAPEQRHRVLIQLSEIVGISKHRFHTTSKVVRRQTRGTLQGLVQGMNETTRFENNTINGVDVCSFELFKSDIAAGAELAKVTLGRPVPSPLVMGTNGIQRSFEKIGPLRSDEMNELMSSLSVELDVIQSLQFAEGSGVAEDMGVINLLTVIHDYLTKHMFNENVVTQNL